MKTSTLVCSLLCLLPSSEALCPHLFALQRASLVSGLLMASHASPLHSTESAPLYTTEGTCLAAHAPSKTAATETPAGEVRPWNLSWWTRKMSMDASNLIWSPRVYKPTILSTLSLLALTSLAQRTGWFSTLFQPSCHSTGTAVGWSALVNVALPLLASACCLIQLALNLLAVGCAGFNTYLGPLRPYFLSLLIVTSIKQPSLHWTSTLLRGSIALLPEVVDWVNRKYSQLTTSRTRKSQLNVQATMEVAIPTMGCVACINTIQGAIGKLPGVTNVQASLLPLGQKGGTATVKLAADSSDDMVDLVTDVLESLDRAGFAEAEVVGMREKNKA
jgi:copper chaperone CopZ